MLFYFFYFFSLLFSYHSVNTYLPSKTKIKSKIFLRYLESYVSQRVLSFPRETEDLNIVLIKNASIDVLLLPHL